MYSQGIVRPASEKPFHRHIGRETDPKARSFLPKPQRQNSPKKLSERGGMKSGTKGPQSPHPKAISKDQKEQMLKKLTPIEYKVTQEKVTERPYSNKYYKHFERGVYSCVVCGEPIFVSQTKYDSKSGWPAFYDIIDESKVTYKQDLSHLGANLLLLVCNPSLARIEVSCAICNAHIGHVFDDGPKPTGKRFCVNSSSLRFSTGDSAPSEVEVEKMEHDGDTWKAVEDNKAKTEPLVHVASPSNSCAMGSQICFRVPNPGATLGPAMS